MKKLLLLICFALLITISCSKDEETIKKTCCFYKINQDGTWFKINVTGVPVDPKTNTPSQETIDKVAQTQNSKVQFCGCN